MKGASGNNRMLMLSSRWIYPLDAGYKMRIHYMAKVLSKLYKIDLLCLEPTGYLPEDIPFENIITFPLNKTKIAFNILKNFRKDWPLQVSGYYDKKVRNFLEKNIKHYDVVYINHIRLAPYGFDLERFSVIDYHDAISMNYRESLKFARGLWKMFYKFESGRLLNLEKMALDVFDLSLITSEVDKEYLLKNADGKRPHNLEVIPMGIREEVLNYPDIGEEKPWIAMLGKMSYYPNYEGAMFFIKEVFPILLKKFDWLELYIVGSNPPKDLKKFDGKNGIHVTGFVEDPWYYVARSLVTVAPVRMGAGIQNKVLEAMALGKAVVGTNKAFLGLNMGIDEKHFIRANDAKEFVNKISYLVENKNIRKDIGLNAKNLIRDHFTWEVIGERLYNIFSNREHEIKHKG
jgi:glycosyltransferase involved in cell wall biosynthesis